MSKGVKGASKTTYRVFGYQHCSYANRACNRVTALAKSLPDTVAAECTIVSRAEFLSWLRSSSSGVPSHHQSSPACFRDKEFIGGCDELLSRLDTQYPSPKEESFCLLQ
jgi:hypothetical protein